jgi:TonB family protein
MMRSQFRRATCLRAIVIAVLVCAFAGASKIAEAAQQSQSPPPAQQAPAPPATNQATPPLAPITSPEIDALAAKLVPEIARRHFGRVVVFGASGPGDKLTQLGQAIGDAVSDSLARRAQDFKVIDRDIMREALKKLRISDAALLNEYLVTLICPKVQAGGAVVVQIKDFDGNAANVEVNLFDWREMEKKPAYSGSFTISLNDMQASAAKQLLNDDGKLLRVESQGSNEVKDSITNPTCEYCPLPAFSHDKSTVNSSGEVWLAVTVLTDGTPTNISIVKNGGDELDAKAVEALLKWKFKPGFDGDGHPAEKRTSVEVQFEWFPNQNSSRRIQPAGPISSTPTPQNLRGTPICLYCPRPDYSQEAKKKKIEGDVWLEILVTPNGDVTEAKVTKSLGYGLDEEAVKAVKKWRFRPLMGPDGQPIKLVATIQVRFQLF